MKKAAKVSLFKNEKKEKPTQPDYFLLLNFADESESVRFGLWKQTKESTGKQYLSGKATNLDKTSLYVDEEEGAQTDNSSSDGLPF